VRPFTEFYVRTGAARNLCQKKKYETVPFKGPIRSEYVKGGKPFCGMKHGPSTSSDIIKMNVLLVCESVPLNRIESLLS
jgi:hypothetical protein